MKAIVQRQYGSPDRLRLQEIDKPVVHDDNVPVRVRAASVDAADPHILGGSPFIARIAMGLRRPKNPVPGSVVAGEVEAVGANVTQHRPGISYSAVATARSPSTRVPERIVSRRNRRTSRSSRPRPFPSPRLPRSRAFATMVGSRRAGRS